MDKIYIYIWDNFVVLIVYYTYTIQFLWLYQIKRLINDLI